MKMRTGLLVLGLVILVCVLAQCECVSALDVPSSLSVSFTFDRPKPTTFSEITSFTISNPENATISFTVSDVTTETGIDIYPSPTSGIINPFGSATISLEVKVSSDLTEGSHTGKVKIEYDGSSRTIPVYIDVKHKTQLEVSPLAIDFGSVDIDEEVLKQVTFKETLGYKPLTVSLSLKEGNNWVRPSEYSFSVSKDSPKTIYFTLSKNKPGWESYKKSYSWRYSVRSEGGDYEISLRTDLKLPAKLSLDSSAYETLIFDRPKSGKPTFYKDVKIGVENKGYYSMSVGSVTTSGFGGLNVGVKSKPSSVGGYSRSNVILSVEAPYDTEEGSYTGRVHVDCGEAGSGDVSVTIKIEHGVSLYVSPTSISFGGVEILTQESKEKVTLSETLGYKSVRDVKISKISGPAWITVTPTSFYGIPPEKSDTATFILLFRGETTTGEVYNWEYSVESANAGKYKIAISAEALPPNLEAIRRNLTLLMHSEIHHNRPKAKEAVAESINVIDLSKEKKLKATDWEQVVPVAEHTVIVLRYLDNFIYKSVEKDKSFLNLTVAAALTQLVEKCSKSISDDEVLLHATKGSSALESLMKEVLIEAASYFEDVGRDSEGSNYLEAVKAYSNAAESYELLGDPKKAREYGEKTSLMWEKHDELVTTANDDRVQAEMKISYLRSKLSEFAGYTVLLNPFAYDEVSSGYDLVSSKYSESIKKYELAGEKRMAEDSSKRLAELNEEWRFLWRAFCIYMIILTFLFSFIVFRLTKGTADFLRDSAEERLGDVVG